MKQSSPINFKELRKELYEKYKTQFASAPIRLFSKIDDEAHKLAKEKGISYDGYSGAIGDIEPGSFPCELRSAMYFGREEELYKYGRDAIKNEISSFTRYNYTATGFETLKKMWMNKYLPMSGNTENFNIYIFNGGMVSFFYCMRSIAFTYMEKKKTSDKPAALIPMPSFPPFLFQTTQFFRVKYLSTAVENQFKLTASDIENVKSEDMDMLYLMVVSNPTSIAYTDTELKLLLDAILRKRPDSVIILDAVYIRTLPEIQCKTLWQTITNPKFMHNVIIIESLSKSYGRTGLRSGVCFINNPDVEQKLNNLLQNEVAGLPYSMQLESIGILSLIEDSAVRQMAEETAKRRKIFLSKYLEKYSNYFLPLNEQPMIPDSSLFWQGGLYVFLKLYKHIDPLDFFLDTGIACVPGQAFWSPLSPPGNFIRVSFGMETMSPERKNSGTV